MTRHRRLSDRFARITSAIETGRRGRAWGIGSSLDIVSDVMSLAVVIAQANPFILRKPHSATKHNRANKNTLARCHNGKLQLSVTGAWRFGNFSANASSRLAAMISPPVFLAIVSSKTRFGFNDRNSSAAGSEAQPTSAR